jgi:hypothetical protein
MVAAKARTAEAISKNERMGNSLVFPVDVLIVDVNQSAFLNEALQLKRAAKRGIFKCAHAQLILPAHSFRAGFRLVSIGSIRDSSLLLCV